nr:YlbF family regulator [Lachnospira eligens]
MSLGYDKDHVIIAKSGDVLELNDEHAQVVDHVQTGAIFVDGLGVGDVGNIVLRDRQNLAENGIIIVVLTLEKYTGQLIAGPDIVTRGFVYVREAEELLDEARAIVSDSVEKCLDKNITDWSKIKNIIKDDLSEYLWKKIKRNPVILPIIMEHRYNICCRILLQTVGEVFFMRRIDELKKEIIHEILNSEEYREYRRLQSEIDRTPDLKRQVDEFRMRNFELQNSENVPDMFAAMENLNKEYADMRNQDIVNRYLMTEITFCRFMRDIYKDIAEAVDMDLDFLG